MNDIIVPNFNANLCVLQVWKHVEVDEGTAEYPIVAWRIIEEDCPIAISVDGESSDSEAHCAMVYDRATKVGTYRGANFHGRERCIQELHDAIAFRQAQGAK